MGDGVEREEYANNGYLRILYFPPPFYVGRRPSTTCSQGFHFERILALNKRDQAKVCACCADSVKGDVTDHHDATRNGFQVIC